MRADRATAEDAETGLEPAPRTAVGNTGAPELRLGAWEGPLDLLLELARAQRVDLSCLSIVDVAEQFGAALEQAVARRRVPLSRLGDWLVMAAHLALLRSRLLLPDQSAEREEARRDAEALRRRLADREFVRRLADWLERRPQLGREVFPRGAAEDFATVDGAPPQADVTALLRACLSVLELPMSAGAYRPAPLPLWRVQEALARLRRLLPAAPEGAALEHFLPDMPADGPDAGLRRRAALASTLMAGLEMGREGSAVLAQEAAFGRIVVASRAEGSSSVAGRAEGLISAVPAAAMRRKVVPPTQIAASDPLPPPVFRS